MDLSQPIFILIAAVVVIIIIALIALFFVKKYPALTDQTKTDLKTTAMVVVVILSFLFVAAIVFSLLGIWTPPQFPSQGAPDTNNIVQSDNDLGLVVIRSVVALLVVIGALTVVFSRLKLPSPNEALGLPAGSIRALIALLLVLIFAIYSIRLLTFAGGEIREYEGLSLEQRDKMLSDPTKNVLGSSVQAADKTYTVIARDPIPDSAKDLGGQIMTTISTLTTAVAAFYFGAQAVNSALKKDTEADPPQITGVSPNSWSLAAAAGAASTTAKFTITGSNFSSPKVTLENGSTVLTPLANVGNEGTTIDCELTLPTATPQAVYQIVVVNDAGSGKDTKRPNAFEVKA